MITLIKSAIVPYDPMHLVNHAYVALTSLTLEQWFVGVTIPWIAEE